MKRLVCLLLLGALVKTASCQNISYVNAAWIRKMKEVKNDTVYVINFWATWCQPCVDELPHFEQLNANYKNTRVKVIMVSCDFKKQIDSRLKPFIKNKKMQSQVVFMNESNPDVWIEKVSAQWSGAIPATLFLCGSKNFESFHEGEMNYNDLHKIIQPLIK